MPIDPLLSNEYSDLNLFSAVSETKPSSSYILFKTDDLIAPRTLPIESLLSIENLG